MSSRRIVLFDIDGTLLRGAGPHHKQALIEGARNVFNVECTLDGVDTAGRLDRDLLAVMLSNAGLTRGKINRYMTALVEASQHHYTVNCKADLTPHLCPGVRQTLELLRASDIPVGIVTGNLSAIAWRKLELARIHHYFSFGAFAEEGKTRTWLAKIAVRQAKRKALADKRCRVTLIGDHANDIDAAKANGFRAIAVATGVMSSNELERCKPDLVLNNLEQADLETIFGA